VAELNRRYAFVSIGGKAAVLREIEDHKGIPCVEYMKPSDFATMFSNIIVDCPNKRDVIEKQPLGKTWITHLNRRSHTGVAFDPSSNARVVNGYYNLWRGYGVEPRPGSWEKLKRHILDIIADGEVDCFEYIINWIAWSVQNPGKKAEVALVIRSNDEGAGKGIFFRALVSLFGRHGKQINSPNLVFGKFNGHLQDCCLMFVDEGFWAGDKKAEKLLMGLITEPTWGIEHKGLGVVFCPNYVKIVIAANDQWVVPASATSRRYAVFEIKKEIEGGNKKKYFGGIQDELDNGGHEAMLHDLLDRDLGDWHPREGVPNTEALFLQRTASMSYITEWIGELIAEGRLPAIGVEAKDEPDFASYQALCQSLAEFSGPQRVPGAKKLKGELRPWKVESHTKDQTCRGYRFPPLRWMRDEWVKKYGPQDFLPFSDWGIPTPDHPQVKKGVKVATHVKVSVEKG
jgi:hypothetical protein